VLDGVTVGVLVGVLVGVTAGVPVGVGVTGTSLQHSVQSTKTLAVQVAAGDSHAGLTPSTK